MNREERIRLESKLAFLIIVSWLGDFLLFHLQGFFIPHLGGKYQQK
jgi:hypothetical protein